jgi:hypothetical protein
MLFRSFPIAWIPINFVSTILSLVFFKDDKSQKKIKLGHKLGEKWLGISQSNREGFP